jgi:hypothetical protein
MNPEAIRERIAKLRAEREELVHQLIAFDGAIQDCEFWLSLAEGPEEKEAPCPPSDVSG